MFMHSSSHRAWQGPHRKSKGEKLVAGQAQGISRRPVKVKERSLVGVPGWLTRLSAQRKLAGTRLSGERKWLRDKAEILARAGNSHQLPVGHPPFWLHFACL